MDPTARASETARLKGTTRNEKTPGGRQATGRVLQISEICCALALSREGHRSNAQILAAFFSRLALPEPWTIWPAMPIGVS
jgi:hypothetical protein